MKKQQFFEKNIRIYKLGMIILFNIITGTTVWATPTTKTSVVINPIKIQTGVAINELNANAPKEYQIKKTDTIVKLANMYLRDLTKWPLLFGVDVNSRPKLYPQDILVLIKNNGYAHLMLKSKLTQTKSKNIEKLEPIIRELSSEQQVRLIGLTKLRNLLSKRFIMESSTFDLAPMLIAGPEGQDMYSLGDTIYARNFIGQSGDIVSLFSPLRTINDPDTKEELGFAVRYNGVAIVDSVDKISTLHIITMYNTISRGDKVLPMLNADNTDISLKYATKTIQGKIVALENGVTFTAEDNSVAINRGSNDSVEAGQVMQIYSNRKVLDIDSTLSDPKYIQLPPEVIGELIIYKVYPKLSFGLITDSIRPIYLNTMVKSEQQ